MATKVPLHLASNGQPMEQEERVVFEQNHVPRNFPDALAATALCPCGFKMYGTSVIDLKTLFERFGCPSCHESLVGE